MDGAELHPEAIFSKKGKAAETWIPQSTGFPNDGAFTYSTLTQVMGSPHGTLIAGMSRGTTKVILRSTDGGVTWTETLTQTAWSWGGTPVFLGTKNTGTYLIMPTYANNYAAYYYSANDGLTWSNFQALNTGSAALCGSFASNGKGLVWAHVGNPATIRHNTGWGSSSTWTTVGGTSSIQVAEYNPVHDDWLGSKGSTLYRAVGTTLTFNTAVTWGLGGVRDIKAFLGYYFVMTTTGSIYRTPGPLGTTTTWTLVYSQSGLNAGGKIANFIVDSSGRLWAFFPNGYLIYTTDGQNWTSVTPPLKINNTFIAQYGQDLIYMLPVSQSFAIYRFGVPSLSDDLITIQSDQVRTGASSYQINPQGVTNLLEHSAGSESRQRIGFAFNYPAGAPSGEIPLAAFARSVPPNNSVQARRFNFELTTGASASVIAYVLGDGTITAESTLGTYYPWQGMNGAAGNYWKANKVSQNPTWLQLYLGTNFPKQRLVYYTLTAASSSLVSLWKWSVQASNDGVMWDTLDTRLNQPVPWTSGERRTYMLDETSEPYSYFRLNLLGTNPGNVYYTLGDWGLFGIPEIEGADISTTYEDALIGLYLDGATGTLRVRGEDGALWAESEATLNPTNWYYLEFSHDPTAGGSVRVEGAEVCTWTDTSIGIDTLQIGAFSPTTATYYVDDIALSDGETIPGPLKVYYLTPDEDGAYTGWDTSTPEMTRAEILSDESDDTYLYSFSETCSFHFNNLAVNRNVLGIQPLSRLSKEDSRFARTGWFLRQNQVNTSLGIIDPALTPTWYRTVLDKQPDNQPWTPNTVNALEIGWNSLYFPDSPTALAATNGSNPVDISVTFDPPVFTDNLPILEYETELTIPESLFMGEYAEQHTKSPMTSDTTPDPLVASASSTYNDSYAAWRAFATLTESNTDWCSAAIAGDKWVQIDFAQPVFCGNYQISNGNRSGGDEPKAWTLSGSEDGISWTVVDTQLNVVWTQTINNWKSVTLSQTYQYRYWRWTITAAAGAIPIQGDGVISMLPD